LLNSLVALLGAHSLGYTNTSISGYGFTDTDLHKSADKTILNAWDSTPHILDNEYFFQLTQKVLLIKAYLNLLLQSLLIFFSIFYIV